MKFVSSTLTLLWAAAAAGPAAADHAASTSARKRKLGKSSAKKNVPLRRNQAEEDIPATADMPKAKVSCYEEKFQVGVQQVTVAFDFANSIWSFLGYQCFGFACPIVYSDQVKEALWEYPTLIMIEDSITDGGMYKSYEAYDLAKDISSLFVGMSCKEYDEFLEQVGAFQEAFQEDPGYYDSGPPMGWSSQSPPAQSPLSEDEEPDADAEGEPTL